MLDGILFDFDKATLKPESKPALDAIAKFLADNPALKALIVGHTDGTTAGGGVPTDCNRCTYGIGRST